MWQPPLKSQTKAGGMNAVARVALAAFLFLTSTVPLPAQPEGPLRTLTFSWPAEGSVQLAFGVPDRAGGITQGISLEAGENAPVSAAADGTALYVGPFRGFGSLLILDHGCGLHSILAGTLHFSVAIGQEIRRGDQVGIVAAPKQDGPQVYFELRRDGIATDPALVMPPRGADAPRDVVCRDVKAAEISASPSAPESPSAQSRTSPQASTAGIAWTGNWPWPVRGEILRAFKVEGNDGIDIAVPEGTDVKAVENGIVIYAGDGLRDFGNTVLLRHDDGLVTVYGHLSELKGRRGQTVIRGETIGKSGKTGIARRPQLQFQIRKKSAPVDPAAYLTEP